MSKAAQRALSARAIDPEKELIALLRSFGHSRRHLEVFSDFVEMGALAMSNAVDPRQRAAREARYLTIIGRYNKDEAQRFARMLGALTLAHEHHMAATGPTDVLGSVYMTMGLGDPSAGQFFTPFSVSRLMAGIAMVDVRDQIARQRFVTMMEPACGAGGMVIAAASVIAEAGLNFQDTLHATAIDVDVRCVHMTYLQLALLHIPAVVLHGNALSQKIFDVWRTPAHILGGWSTRFRPATPEGRRSAELADVGGADAGEAPAKALPHAAVPPPPATRLAEKAIQLGLF